MFNPILHMLLRPFDMCGIIQWFVQTAKYGDLYACMLYILYVCQRQSTQNRETDKGSWANIKFVIRGLK